MSPRLAKPIQSQIGNRKSQIPMALIDKLVARISQWIEDDSVSQDMYQERLGQILELGAQSDKDALAQAGLSGAGQELMNIWNQMDRGSMKEDEAFEEADKAVRKRA